MENKIVKHKWFWAWQDDKEEEWLSDMSKQGCHLSKPGYFGRYEFEQGEPRNYVYRLDFMTGKKDQKETYLQYFIDAGWEYLGEYGSWQYFRILAEENEKPEIYTDTVSKIQKYRRVLLLLVILFPIYMLPLNLHNVLERDPHWLMTGILILWVILLFVYGISAIKILGRIKELRKTIKQ